MTISPAILDAMVASGCTAEQIAAVVKADIAELTARMEAKRANNNERQRRFRARHAEPDSNADNALQPLDNADNATAPLSRPPNENNSNPPTHTPVNKSRARKGWPAPDGVNDGQWDAFCRQRKKPLNEHSFGLLTAKLATLARDGWPPGEMIDRAIEHGWETVFPPKDGRNGSPQRSQNNRNGASGKADGFTAALREARGFLGDHPADDPGGSASFAGMG